MSISGSSEKNLNNEIDEATLSDKQIREKRQRRAERQIYRPGAWKAAREASEGSNNSANNVANVGLEFSNQNTPERESDRIDDTLQNHEKKDKAKLIKNSLKNQKSNKTLINEKNNFDSQSKPKDANNMKDIKKSLKLSEQNERKSKNFSDNSKSKPKVKKDENNFKSIHESYSGKDYEYEQNSKLRKKNSLKEKFEENTIYQNKGTKDLNHEEVKKLSDRKKKSFSHVEGNNNQKSRSDEDFKNNKRKEKVVDRFKTNEFYEYHDDYLTNTNKTRSSKTPSRKNSPNDNRNLERDHKINCKKDIDENEVQLSSKEISSKEKSFRNTANDNINKKNIKRNHRDWKIHEKNQFDDNIENAKQTSVSNTSIQDFADKGNKITEKRKGKQFSSRRYDNSQSKNVFNEKFSPSEQITDSFSKCEDSTINRANEAHSKNKKSPQCWSSTESKKEDMNRPNTLELNSGKSLSNAYEEDQYRSNYESKINQSKYDDHPRLWYDENEEIRKPAKAKSYSDNRKNRKQRTTMSNDDRTKNNYEEKDEEIDIYELEEVGSQNRDYEFRSDQKFDKKNENETHNYEKNSNKRGKNFSKTESVRSKILSDPKTIGINRKHNNLTDCSYNPDTNLETRFRNIDLNETDDVFDSSRIESIEIRPSKNRVLFDPDDKKWQKSFHTSGNNKANNKSPGFWSDTKSSPSYELTSKPSNVNNHSNEESTPYRGGLIQLNTTKNVNPSKVETNQHPPVQKLLYNPNNPNKPVAVMPSSRDLPNWDNSVSNRENSSSPAELLNQESNNETVGKVDPALIYSIQKVRWISLIM